MELGNAEVRIGGSLNNSVVKYGVTPSEVQLLQAIHGGLDSVRNIVVTGNVKRSNAEEINRLKLIYGAKDKNGNRFVDVLFPGVNVQLLNSFADIGLPEELFDQRAKRQAEKNDPIVPQRVVPVSTSTQTDPDEDLDDDADDFVLPGDEDEDDGDADFLGTDEGKDEDVTPAGEEAKEEAAPAKPAGRRKPAAL